MTFTDASVLFCEATVSTLLAERQWKASGSRTA